VIPSLHIIPRPSAQSVPIRAQLLFGSSFTSHSPLLACLHPQPASLCACRCRVPLHNGSNCPRCLAAPRRLVTDPEARLSTCSLSCCGSANPASALSSLRRLLWLLPYPPAAAPPSQPHHCHHLFTLRPHCQLLVSVLILFATPCSRILPLLLALPASALLAPFTPIQPSATRLNVRSVMLLHITASDPARASFTFSDFLLRLNPPVPSCQEALCIARVLL
jgi:hypothetical protein